MRTLLHDPAARGARARAPSACATASRKWVEKGRVGEDAAGAARAGARRSTSSRRCELVIEAAPERPELKRDLFGALSVVCGDDVVLATQHLVDPGHLAGGRGRAGPRTSSGMHFFNPPPLMPLLEVIRADQTGDRAVELAAGGRRRRWARR